MSEKEKEGDCLSKGTETPPFTTLMSSIFENDMSFNPYNIKQIE